MKRTIMFGSLIAFFLIIMIPNVNAVEYNQIEETIKIELKETINSKLNKIPSFITTKRENIASIEEHIENLKGIIGLTNNIGSFTGFIFIILSMLALVPTYFFLTFGLLFLDMGGTFVVAGGVFTLIGLAAGIVSIILLSVGISLNEAMRNPVSLFLIFMIPLLITIIILNGI